MSRRDLLAAQPAMLAAEPPGSRASTANPAGLQGPRAERAQRMKEMNHTMGSCVLRVCGTYAQPVHVTIVLY